MVAGLGENNYPREIDNKISFDYFGRKSRLLVSKENIEKIGLEYNERRCIKIKVSPDFIDNVERVKRIALINQYFYYKGLSPKIYNVGTVIIDKIIYPYFEVGYIGDKKNTVNIQEIKNKIIEEAKKVDWITKIYDVDLENQDNYIGNKYIDFHGWEMDMDKFYIWLKELIGNQTHWGHTNEQGKRYAYQDYDYEEGKRRVDLRIKHLGIDTLDLKNKTVLDIGCNLGMMANYASENGAKRVAGVDLKPVIEAADLYRTYKGYKTEFYYDKLDSKKLKDYGKFDVVFYLAMSYSLGFPSELSEITNEVLIYEGHEGEKESETGRKLKGLFRDVRFNGFTFDRGKRPIFTCYK